MGSDERSPTLREPRRRVPVDTDEGRTDDRYRPMSSRPEQELVVFVLTTWDLFIRQADAPEEVLTTQHDIGGVDLHPPRPQEIAEGDLPTIGDPNDIAAMGSYNDARGHDNGIRGLVQHLDLTTKFLPQPLVVVVAESQEVSVRRERSAVPCPREARRPHIGDAMERSVGWETDVKLLRRALVEDDDALNVTWVLLFDHCPDRSKQQLRSVARGDDD